MESKLKEYRYLSLQKQSTVKKPPCSEICPILTYSELSFSAAFEGDGRHVERLPIGRAPPLSR